MNAEGYRRVYEDEIEDILSERDRLKERVKLLEKALDDIIAIPSSWQLNLFFVEEMISIAEKAKEDK